MSDMAWDDMAPEKKLALMIEVLRQQEVAAADPSGYQEYQQALKNCDPDDEAQIGRQYSHMVRVLENRNLIPKDDELAKLALGIIPLKGLARITALDKHARDAAERHVKKK